MNAASEIISCAVEEHGRAALMFSGGLESCLLLHLASPWREKVTVYALRTNLDFPHMIEFVDQKLTDWSHRVIQVDLTASFQQYGLPSSVVPVDHMPDMAQRLAFNQRQPLIQPWLTCCFINRTKPLLDAVHADGLRAVVHGQRAGDFEKLPTTGPKMPSHPELEPVYPLWPMSRTEVFETVKALGIKIPYHYKEYPSSLDCSVCPASLTSERRAWMSQRYPAFLQGAEALEKTIRGAVMTAMDADNTSCSREETQKISC